MVLLKDHGRLPAVVAQYIRVGQGPGAANRDRTACRRDQMVQDPQQSRFAGAGRTEQHRDLVVREAQVERFEANITVRVNNFYAIQRCERVMDLMFHNRALIEVGLARAPIA